MPSDLALDLNPEDVQCFQESLDRCTADPSFFHRFYARFMLSDPEIASRFQGVDMRRQASVLRSSLYLVLRAASGLEDGLAHLADVSRTHAKNGHDIGPHLYEHWLNALLAVVSETDPHYEEGVGQAWESTLRSCINVMIARAG